MNPYSTAPSAVISATVQKRKRNIAVPVVVPTLEQLTFDIFDIQRKMISEVEPKRYKCSIPTPFAYIEKLYRDNPAQARFDGMTHEDAIVHFHEEALANSVFNQHTIPFLFAKQITIHIPAFNNAVGYLFEKIDGIRVCKITTQHEFYWLSTTRTVISNISFNLNAKYNCNLHLNEGEADRIFRGTGDRVPANRKLFIKACDIYLKPAQNVTFYEFLRCQVPSLRKYTVVQLEGARNNPGDFFTTEEYLEFMKAKEIYTGEINQWVGSFPVEL